MKYYIGYFNKPWDKSEFTVIAATPNEFSAHFIFEQYKSFSSVNSVEYKLLTAAEIMDLKIVF